VGLPKQISCSRPCALVVFSKDLVVAQMPTVHSSKGGILFSITNGTRKNNLQMHYIFSEIFGNNLYILF
jgi:hypothetical protein